MSIKKKEPLSPEREVLSLLALLELSLLALLGLARESPGSQLTCFTRKKSTNAGTVADLLLLLTNCQSPRPSSSELSDAVPNLLLPQ